MWPNSAVRYVPAPLPLCTHVNRHRACAHGKDPSPARTAHTPLVLAAGRWQLGRAAGEVQGDEEDDSGGRGQGEGQRHSASARALPPVRVNVGRIAKAHGSAHECAAHPHPHPHPRRVHMLAVAVAVSAPFLGALEPLHPSLEGIISSLPCGSTPFLLPAHSPTTTAPRSLWPSPSSSPPPPLPLPSPQDVIKQRDTKLVTIGNIVHDSVPISKDEVGGCSGWGVGGAGTT